MILDLFAGPGGWDHGAASIGLHPIGIEWDHAACRTAVAAGYPRIRADVATYPTAHLRGKIVGLIASPPCQAWSMAGKRLGENDRANCHLLVDRMAAGDDTTDWTEWEDDRSPLVAQPVRWTRDLRPEWVTLEQVPPVLGLWQHVARILRGWGYSVWCGVLNAADYGVPQTRQRAILIASRVRTVTPPEPTHCRGGAEPDLFGRQLAPWVSMATALGWGATARPVPTITSGDTTTGGAEPIAHGGRDALEREREREDIGWIGYRLHRGQGMTDRHGQRPDTPADQPAPVVTSKARTATWELTAPPCDCGGAVYRNGNQANSAERCACQPAPTLLFGHRHNDVRWVVDRRTNSKGPGHRAGAPMVPTAPVPVDEPAPTLTSKAGGQWVVRPDWPFERPATTVVGSFSPDVIAAPGYRTQTSRQNAEASVRVTVAEASVLQSFPADYPWAGSRTKQFEQIGNAVPPLLAAHILAAAAGLPTPARSEAAS